MQFTENQQKAFELMKKGENVFITGSGGTGKSYVIKEFEKYAKSVGRKIAITSTTGISALLLGGTTLHSYLCIGLGQEKKEDLAEKIMMSYKAKRRWTKLDILVIDEVSMLSPELFDKLDYIAKVTRSSKFFLSNRAFGGIQLILSGDFLQLPVVKSDKFCFEAESWSSCIKNVIELTEVVRQEDKQFISILNMIRYGIVNDEVKDFLLQHKNKELTNNIGIKPTKIYTTNNSVDYINEKELQKLFVTSDQCYSYDLIVELADKKYATLAEKQIRNCPAPEKLVLCKGAQVMLVYNVDLDSGLANGSRGVVVDFLDQEPVVTFFHNNQPITRVITTQEWVIKEDDEPIISYLQIPLRLAWCITCHKVQGITLDYAEVCLDNLFACGQAYVALSRVRSENGLSISYKEFPNIKADPKALQFYKEI